MAQDLYQTITDKIVAAIEAGAGAWHMPWHTDRSTAGDDATVAMPRNITGRSYRGLNVPLLWAEAAHCGYSSPIWGTYKQWQQAGAQVRKGEKSAMVIFWKRIAVKSRDEADGDDEGDETRLIARGYFVFNAEQVDGYKPNPAAEKPPEDRIAEAERFFAATGSIVRHGGDRAYYTTGGDFIAMPSFRQFDEAEAYYSTLAHEHVHWTGAKHRLDREFGKRFGDQAYAAEELVAELGAAFCCATLGISNEPRPDHAAYVANWLQVLKNDKRAIFTAASKAQAAVDFLAEFEAKEEKEAA